MKKPLCIILTIVALTSLFGCSKVEEVSVYEFEYKFKEEYSEIDSKLAGTFIGMVMGLLDVHDTALDFNDQSKDDMFSEYRNDYFVPYIENPENLKNTIKMHSDEENEILRHMLDIAKTTSHLAKNKLEYKMDKMHEEMGLKRQYENEHYLEIAEDYKEQIEGLLEKTKQFID